jgi:hypothetical protein
MSKAPRGPSRAEFDGHKLAWRLLPRQQRLFYSIFETPMLSGMPWLTQTQPKIKVIVDDEEIAAPRVVTVRLVAKCTRDIPNVLVRPR